MNELAAFRDAGPPRDSRPVGSTVKFFSYSQLLGTCEKTGCPVCARLTQSALKALDELMHELVNDPFTGDRLVESHGFCNWHAWMLPSIHNSALGVALIFRHLLQQTLGHLHPASREARPRLRWGRLWERPVGSGQKPVQIPAWRRIAVPPAERVGSGNT